MRIALIADLHGNRTATEALEKDLSATRPDQIWCLGDVCGKGPRSAYTADWALANCTLLLRGNWEEHLYRHTFGEKDRYWLDALGPRLDQLGILPNEARAMLNGRNVRLIHGRELTPRPMRDTLPDEEWAPYFTASDGTRCSVLIYADVHRPCLRVQSSGYLINCGSVGNALGQPFGSYALLEADFTREPSPLDVRFRIFDYDRSREAEEAAREPDLPCGSGYIREVLTGVYSRGRFTEKERGNDQ